MIIIDLTSNLKAKLNKVKVIVLIVSRQVGKTTLINAILNKSDYLFLDGDDNTVAETISNANTENLKSIIGNYKYVFIDEKRAAALEPSNALSGYEYNKGFGYYQSVRDAGYQFFAEQIPSGISTITYETIVAKEGTIDNGPISLQCMYQPAVKAYGAGSLLKVMK